MPSTIKLHRVFKTTPEKIYKAFTTPDAMAKWLPPNGYTAKVQEMDSRVGGKYRMSFTDFNTGQEMGFGGKYLELVPNARLRYEDKFDDPNLPGTITVTVDIKKVSVGAELHIVQEGIPDAIPADGCYLGWADSLDQLRALVEAPTPPEA